MIKEIIGKRGSKMTSGEYSFLQEKFSEKIVSYSSTYVTNREAAYNKGVKACKSMLKTFYSKQKNYEPVTIEWLLTRFDDKIKSCEASRGSLYDIKRQYVPDYIDGVAECIMILRKYYRMY